MRVDCHRHPRKDLTWIITLNIQFSAINVFFFSSSSFVFRTEARVSVVGRIFFLKVWCIWIVSKSSILPPYGAWTMKGHSVITRHESDWCTSVSDEISHRLNTVALSGHGSRSAVVNEMLKLYLHLLVLLCRAQGAGGLHTDFMKD